MMDEVGAHYTHGKTSSNSHCANFLHYEKKSEMEFLYNTLTKYSSVRLHAIHGFYRKHTHSGLKNSKNKKKLQSIHD